MLLRILFKDTIEDTLEDTIEVTLEDKHEGTHEATEEQIINVNLILKVFKGLCMNILCSKLFII